MTFTTSLPLLAHLAVLEAHEESFPARGTPDHLYVADEGLHDPLPLFDALEGETLQALLL